MQQQKRILICPLDWGLGHATRCIPIIRSLLAKDMEVIIAADGRPLELLRKEFPDLRFIPMKGYGIDYPVRGSMAVKMLFSVPKILRGIKKEQEETERIVKENRIDVVISDNRYGCFSKNAKNIFITHQLMIKTPFGEKLLHRKVLEYIRNYDECWLPDHEGADNLSADLSHKYPVPANAFFIGPLSRFGQEAGQADQQYDLMAIISGPEPQRSVFERLAAEQAYRNGLKALLVFGIPEGKSKTEQKKNVTMVSHLGSAEMEAATRNSAIILCRAGYSSIMDLSALQKKAILVPTPGQTEQEYLARELKKKKIAYSMSQSEFDLQKALKESEGYTGFKTMRNSDLLENRIRLL